jgi:hypothetical protein
MSFDDDRDIYGNHRSPSYSADEAYNSGARPWESKSEVDYKVNQARMKQWEWVSSDPHAGESSAFSYPGGGGVTISSRGILIFLLSLISIAAITYFCFDRIRELRDARYPSDKTNMVLFDLYYYPPKGTKPPFNALKSIMLEQFKEKYGALFSSQVPWDELYKDCTPQKRSCLINPYASVEKLRSFALKPSTLMEDICAINGHQYYGTHIDFPAKPVWRVRFLENGKKPSSPSCTVANVDEYIKTIKTKIVFMFWMYVGLGVIVSILSIVILKRVFSVKKPVSGPKRVPRSSA